MRFGSHFLNTIKATLGRRLWIGRKKVFLKFGSDILYFVFLVYAEPKLTICSVCSVLQLQFVIVC
jgi:hypothetical protein